jgi:UDP-2-acetamido-3-amino-2,3-dideoxy-glucuronate N-acetyltransferase
MIAVIGNGHWGKNLVRNFDDLGVLSMVCDVAQGGPTVEHVLRSDVEGVVIATPAETHYDIAKRALLSGKHVYIEKPMVLSVEHAEELLRIKGDRVLMVGHLLRYHNAFVKMQELVKEPYFIHSMRLGKYMKRKEGQMWSLAPHDVSMILALMGEMPSSVDGDDDGFYINMGFQDGKVAFVDVDWNHPTKTQKIYVEAEGGVIVFDDTKDWDNKLMYNGKHVDLEPHEPLRAECSHFLECITSGKQPLTDGKEGLCVTQILSWATE